MLTEAIILAIGWFLGGGELPGGKKPVGPAPGVPGAPATPGHPTHVVPAESPSKAPWPAENKRPATAEEKAAMQAAADPFMAPGQKTTDWGTDEEALLAQTRAKKKPPKR